MLSKTSFIKKTFFTCSMISLPFLSAFADTDNPTTADAEKIYLVQIINQLDAMQPLVIAAEKAQQPDKRVQFHYEKYQDNNGQWHNGLLEDVQSIKAGITQYLSQPAIEPRTVQPLQGDYLDLKPISDNVNRIVSEVPHADG